MSTSFTRRQYFMLQVWTCHLNSRHVLELLSETFRINIPLKSLSWSVYGAEYADSSTLSCSSEHLPPAGRRKQHSPRESHLRAPEINYSGYGCQNNLMGASGSLDTSWTPNRRAAAAQAGKRLHYSVCDFPLAAFKGKHFSFKMSTPGAQLRLPNFYLLTIILIGVKTRKISLEPDWFCKFSGVSMCVCKNCLQNQTVCFKDSTNCRWEEANCWCSVTRHQKQAVGCWRAESCQSLRRFFCEELLAVPSVCLWKETFPLNDGFMPPWD